MAKVFSRTIENSTIECASVRVENGQLVTIGLEPIMVEEGNVTNEKAIKLVQKTYGKTGQYVILDIVKTQEVYEISIDDLKKYGKKVVKVEKQENVETVEN